MHLQISLKCNRDLISKDSLTFFLSFPLLSLPLSGPLPGAALPPPRLSSGVLLLGLDLYLPGSAFLGAALCGPPLMY